MKLLIGMLTAFGLMLILAAGVGLGLYQGNYPLAAASGALLLLFTLLLKSLYRRLAVFFKSVRAAFAPVPENITLTPIERVNWPDPETGRRLFQEILRIGFRQVSPFSIDEMPGVELIGFVNASESAYAVLYHHPRVGIWMDIAGRYQDGGSLTLTSTNEAGMLDKPEGWVTVKAVDASPAELLARFRANRRKDAERRPVSAENFKSDFEGAYAEEMAWRRDRGGPTEDEVRRVSVNSGIMASEETIQRTVEIKKV